MDWNKTKSIFIAVFLILNAFLYYQYLSSYQEDQNREYLTKNSIEMLLKEDNITFDSLPNAVENLPYISANVKSYSYGELPKKNNLQYNIIGDNELIATFNEPIKIQDTASPAIFKEFLNRYVYEGAAFELWEIDEEARTAIFFQRVNDHTLYYNINANGYGYVKIYWNTDDEVIMYEQTMLENIKPSKKKENIDQPLQILQTLYANDLLKTNDKITSMKLGYSTLVQITQTQVFAPTWEVRIKSVDGIEEQYFVVDGKVIDMKQELQKEEDPIENQLNNDRIDDQIEEPVEE
ncbi:two-component system regulatory protein YycI [Lysinibacillus sp. 54212]|uniref:two-component system regulatory protein YycI n=1 Tax=Lysinibacillus sp. 54212 TaxID=3119829 RepID=UPI002FC7B8DA